jgi:hypothetical protein
MNKLKIYLISLLTFSNVVFGMEESSLTEAMPASSGGMRPTQTLPQRKSSKSYDDEKPDKNLKDPAKNHEDKNKSKKWKWIGGVIAAVVVIGSGAAYWILKKKDDDNADEKINNKA